MTTDQTSKEWYDDLMTDLTSKEWYYDDLIDFLEFAQSERRIYDIARIKKRERQWYWRETWKNDYDSEWTTRFLYGLEWEAQRAIKNRNYGLPSADFYVEKNNLELGNEYRVALNPSNTILEWEAKPPIKKRNYHLTSADFYIEKNNIKKKLTNEYRAAPDSSNLIKAGMFVEQALNMFSIDAGNFGSVGPLKFHYFFPLMINDGCVHLFVEHNSDFTLVVPRSKDESWLDAFVTLFDTFADNLDYSFEILKCIDHYRFTFNSVYSGDIDKFLWFLAENEDAF